MHKERKEYFLRPWPLSCLRPRDNLTQAKGASVSGRRPAMGIKVRGQAGGAQHDSPQGIHVWTANVFLHPQTYLMVLVSGNCVLERAYSVGKYELTHS